MKVKPPAVPHETACNAMGFFKMKKNHPTWWLAPPTALVLINRKWWLGVNGATNRMMTQTQTSDSPCSRIVNGIADVRQSKANDDNPHGRNWLIIHRFDEAIRVSYISIVKMIYAIPGECETAHRGMTWPKMLLLPEWRCFGPTNTRSRPIWRWELAQNRLTHMNVSRSMCVPDSGGRMGVGLCWCAYVCMCKCVYVWVCVWPKWANCSETLAYRMA